LVEKINSASESQQLSGTRRVGIGLDFIQQKPFCRWVVAGVDSLP
jgi:hypothetical protein